jgi:glycosyl transferase family 25
MIDHVVIKMKLLDWISLNKLNLINISLNLNAIYLLEKIYSIYEIYMKYKDYLKKILILKKNNMETENDCFNETNIETEDDCFKNDYNNIFDEVFYINLEHRVDRKLEIESELDKIGLKYKRFNAIKNKNGAIGCAKSHLELIKYARDNKLKNILIFEDDFQFIISKDIFWKNINYFINKCVDYDILLLGSNYMESNNYDDKLLKIIDAQTASCYLANEKIYDKLIKVWEQGLINLEETNISQLFACDQSWKILQPEGNWYTFKNKIGIQRPSYSDIEQKIVNYKC